MIEANVIFTLDGENLTVQCSEDDIMKDICQKYANKIQRDLNSLVFLYGGNQLNFLLKFKDLVTDKERNEMKVLVYSKEKGEFTCPKCGEKIQLNTDKIDDRYTTISIIYEEMESKEEKFNNIIYYDERYDNNNINISNDIDYFERITNGAFFLCSNINSLELIKKDIIKKIEKDTDRDYWLSAEESKSYGLISRVINKRSDLS